MSGISFRKCMTEQRSFNKYFFSFSIKHDKISPGGLINVQKTCTKIMINL